MNERADARRKTRPPVNETDVKKQKLERGIVFLYEKLRRGK